MQYTRLGKSDLLVSRICMGCMGFGDPLTGQHRWTLDETESRHINLDASPYKAFVTQAPDMIDRKLKITLVPQFTGDKHIIPDERTINNLVVVQVKPEYQTEFKNIVLPEMAQSLNIEKGVLAMYAATDVDDPHRWYFYEIYASEEDYQLHRQTPHFRDYLKQTAHMSTRKTSIPVNPLFLRNKGGITAEIAPGG